MTVDYISRKDPIIRQIYNDLRKENNNSSYLTNTNGRPAATPAVFPEYTYLTFTLYV